MIGIILKNMRSSKNLTQYTLGKKLNLSDTTISSYERENSQPDFATIAKIAEACDFKICFKNSNGTILTLEDMSKEQDF